MKKAFFMTVLVSSVSFSAFAANTTKFYCSATGLDATPFELAPNTGVMPLVQLGNRTVSVNFTEDANNVEKFEIIIKGNDKAENADVSGDISKAPVTYVSPDFYVACSTENY